jgi:hypothetical protein
MHGVVRSESEGNEGGDTDDFIDDTLVGVEVEREAWVADRLQAGSAVVARLYSLLFNEHAGGSLGSFGANATLKHD